MKKFKKIYIINKDKEVLIMDERKNYYSQDNKESVTYSQAKKALEKVQNILDKYNIRI